VKTHAQQQSVFTCGNLGNLWFLRGHQSIMQNKPNFKMGNINISVAQTKAYANEQRTMNSKRYPKQTQSNPKLEFCSTLSRVEGPIKPKTLTAGTKSCLERPVVSKVEPSRRDAIRSTQYAVRNTNLAQPPPGSHNMKKMCLRT